MDREETRDVLTAFQSTYSREISTAVEGGPEIGLLWSWISLVVDLWMYRLLPRIQAHTILRESLRRTFPDRLQYLHELFGQDKRSVASVIGPFNEAQYKEARAGEDMELPLKCERMMDLSRIMRDERVGLVRAKNWICNGRRDPENVKNWLIEPCNKLIQDLVNGTDTCPYLPIGAFMSDPRERWDARIILLDEPDQPSDWHVDDRYQWRTATVRFRRSLRRPVVQHIHRYHQRGEWIRTDPLGRAVHDWTGSIVTGAEIVDRYTRRGQDRRIRGMGWGRVLLESWSHRRRHI